MEAKHYVYQILNLKNNKIYIGVRTHPNPELDSYMGSGTCIQKVIEIEGISNFKKEIIKIFQTREEAENYEGELLTEEFCNSTQTYNINRTGIFIDNKHCFRKDLWYDYYNEIREQYQQGKTLKELGFKYKCDRGTIKNLIKDIQRTVSESQQLRFEKFTSGRRDLNFDKTNLNRLLELYQIEKWSVNRISTYFNKSTAFINKRLSENNIILRKRKDNIEKPMKKDRQDIWDNEKEIINLYLKGKTLSDLGRNFKCNNNLIRQILVKNDIKIRNKTENKKLCQK